MNKPKLKLGHIWPDLHVVPDSEPDSPRPRASKQSASVEVRRSNLSHPNTASGRPSRPKGSYFLRRSAQQLARSVYLTRVLERLEKELRREGEAFVSELALVWVSGDGSREVALKGRALRELIAGRV